MYYIVQPSKQVTPERFSAFEEDIKTNPNNPLLIFLAGSIQPDKPIPWHEPTAHAIMRKINKLPNHLDFTVYFINPTNNTEYTPEITDKQINWEQNMINKSDYILMYLDPDSKSPISLLEFGENIASGKLFVSCSKRFHGYPNIRSVATIKNQENHVFASLAEAETALVAQISKQKYQFNARLFWQ